MTTSTPEGRIAGLFGLPGEQWMRHADPWSVRVRLDLLLTLPGLFLCVCAKAWYIDRAVLLFEDVKTRDPGCAAWEYPTPDPRSSS